ncbi:MAG: GrpB family protein [Blastocatellia bacterium]
MEVDEPITIVDYNPEWPRWFADEQARLLGGLGDAATYIEHIGSTAVPGLVAKPIIDLLAGLSAFPPSGRQIAVIEALGYVSLGEAGVPGRWYFRKRGPRSCNLHLTLHGGDLWRNNLLLRDFLHAHPHEAAAYGRHKQDLVAAGARTLLAYSEQKAAIIAALIQKAAKWNETNGFTSQ